MKSKVAKHDLVKSVEVDKGVATITFEDDSTLTPGASVFVKVDGQASSADALLSGDRVEQVFVDGELAVLKVRRETPAGKEAKGTPRDEPEFARAGHH